MKKIILLMITVIALITSANAENLKFSELMKKSPTLDFVYCTNNDFIFDDIAGLYIENKKFNLNVNGEELPNTINGTNIVEKNGKIIFNMNNKLELSFNDEIQKSKNGYIITLDNNMVFKMDIKKNDKNQIELIPFETFKRLYKPNTLNLCK